VDFLDTYSIKARLFPALIVVLPALVLLLLSGEWKDPGLPELLFSVGIGVLFFAIADLARRAGRSVQKRLFKEVGGRPVNTELSHFDLTIDTSTKDRYRNFLAQRIGKPAPTAEEERANPESASDFYADCFTFLRNSTYDTERFRVLFGENITYGFRRNLYGLKKYGILVNVVALIAAYSINYYGGELINISADKALMQGAFALIHASYFIIAVTKASVIDASKIYARQLVMCCEVLIQDNRNS
jgi:hypothetical protein